MADVDDRGQLLLVGAFTLAVMLVALAVLLNAAIYTGNVATRDAGPGTSAVIEYEGEATSMARVTLSSLNERQNESYQRLGDNFTHTVSIWSETARVHTSMSLADASVELRNGPVNGTAIRQSSERNLTSAGRTANWTVANNSSARAFRLNVSQSSLATPDDIVNDLLTDDSPSYFQIEFDNGSSAYRVQVRGTNDSDAIVRVLDESGNQIGTDCEVTDTRVVVNITGGTAGGEDCAALETMFADLGEPYTISYWNSENAQGTYSLVVDRRLDNLDTGADTNGTDEPAATRALYSAELELTYRTADVYYQTTLEIAPGEADD